MREQTERASVPEKRQGQPGLHALVQLLTRTARWCWAKVRYFSDAPERPDGARDAGLGSEEDVLDALQRRAGAQGPDPEGLLLMARHYELHGDLESACRMARVALRLDPSNRRAWNQMGSVRGKMGDVEGAVAAYLHAAEAAAAACRAPDEPPDTAARGLRSVGQGAGSGLGQRDRPARAGGRSTSPSLRTTAAQTAVAARDGRWRDVLRDPVATGLGYLVALSAAEVLTALVKPHAGLVLHALLLFDLCMHAAFTWRQPIHRLLLSLTLVPLIRLLSLSLPLAGLDQIYWYLIISIPLFAAAAVIVRLLGLKPAALGLTLGKRLGLQGTVAVVGVLFGAVEYHILHAEPLVDFTGWVAALGPALTLVICTGFLEELIFRGLLQSAAQEVYGSWAVLYVSALSAVMYVGYRSLLNVLFVFVVGLILGWVTHRSHSILGAALAHGLTNVVLFLIAPFVFGP